MTREERIERRAHRATGDERRSLDGLGAVAVNVGSGMSVNARLRGSRARQAALDVFPAIGDEVRDAGILAALAEVLLLRRQAATRLAAPLIVRDGPLQLDAQGAL